MDLAQQYDQTLQETIGRSQRDRNRILRQQQEQGTNQLSNVPGSSSWSDRGTAGFRGAGFQEVNNVPTIDTDTQQSLGNLFGDYTEGGKAQHGFYGNINPYTTQGADTLFGQQGFKGAAGPEDVDYQKAGFDLPTAWGKTYFKDYDFTQKGGVDDYLKTQGWSDLGQGIDTSLVGLVPELQKNLFNLKENLYSKEGADPRNIQQGTAGFQTKNLGGGKYEIIDASGTSVGTGYKSVQDTIRELEKAAADKWNLTEDTRYQQALSEYESEMARRQHLYGESGWGGDDISSTIPDRPIRQSMYTDNAPGSIATTLFSPYQTGKGGAASDWEALGQLLGGQQAVSVRGEGGELPTNEIQEQISGSNTLFGSTPIIYNGKLLGYKSDLGLGLPTTQDTHGEYSTQSNPFGYSQSKQSSHTNWMAGLKRQLDANKYQGLVQGLGGSQYFAPVSNVDKLPGWTNLETYKYQSRPHGLLEEVFKGLDPFLDKIDPLHNPAQKVLFNADTTEEQSPYFQKIMPMIVNAFLPGVGSAISAADAASTGDSRGVLGGAVSAVLPSLMQGTDFGLGTAGNAAASNAIQGGVSGLIQGGSVQDLLRGAAGGAVGAQVTEGLNKISGGMGTTFSQLGIPKEAGAAIGDFITGAGGNLASNLFKKNTQQGILESALSSGLGRSLGGLYNSAGDITNPKERMTNMSTATNLAKLFQQRKR